MEEQCLTMDKRPSPEPNRRTETIFEMIEGIQSASKVKEPYVSSKGKLRESDHRDQPVREKSKLWSPRQTSLFYVLISKYGTDFSIIKQYFPRKTKTQVKNKFKEEEKSNQENIRNALQAKIPAWEMDLQIENLMKDCSDSQ